MIGASPGFRITGRFDGVIERVREWACAWAWAEGRAFPVQGPEGVIKERVIRGKSGKDG